MPNVKKKILQIVHISDLHYANDAMRQKHSVLTRGVLYNFSSQIPALGPWFAKMAHGLAGHDSGALDALGRILKDISHSPGWDQTPRWMLFTGDLTTWGCPNDIKSALNILTMNARKNAFEPIIMYGNHDVWNSKFPLFSNTNELGVNRTHLRNNHFNHTYPRFERSTNGQNSNPDQSEIELYTVNTIAHERRKNWLAVGHVQKDYYWDMHRSMSLTYQMAELQSLCKQLGHTPALRIIATHHPIDDEGVWRQIFPIDQLYHAEEVSKWINSDSVPNDKTSKTFQLHLAGHTHSTDPTLETPRSCLPPHSRQKPLEMDQVRIVSGTVSQKLSDLDDMDGQEFQLLRFYRTDDDHKKSITLHRYTYVRDQGMSDFEIYTNDDGEEFDEFIIETD